MSNFGIGHLEQLFKYATIPPAVNQIELSPFLQRTELVDYCKSKDIVLEVDCCRLQACTCRFPEKTPDAATLHTLLCCWQCCTVMPCLVASVFTQQRALQHRRCLARMAHVACIYSLPCSAGILTFV